jgi:hypothetical protein
MRVAVVGVPPSARRGATPRTNGSTAGGCSAADYGLNLDWQVPGQTSLSLDLNFSHQDPIGATVNNWLRIPERTLVGISGRYKFSVGRTKATLRSLPRKSSTHTPMRARRQIAEGGAWRVARTTSFGDQLILSRSGGDNRELTDIQFAIESRGLKQLT